MGSTQSSARKAVILPLPKYNGYQRLHYRGILPGCDRPSKALLIIDQLATAKHGDVLVMKNGKRMTLHVFKSSEYYSWLVSEGGRYVHLLHDRPHQCHFSVVVKILTDDE